MKKIICFGDSNTWGYNPIDGSRYPKNIRWTGILAQMLGPDYEIIEEGQNGRTIANCDPYEWGTKCAMDYVVPMLETHMPADMLIIMLGTNDLKRKFGLPAPDIAGSLQNLLVKLKSHMEYHLNCPDMRVLVVAPPLIGENIDKSYFAQFFDGKNARINSEELSKWYKIVAEQFNCEFLDASALVSGGNEDSIHLTPESHKILAEAVYEKICSRERVYGNQYERLIDVIASLRAEDGCPWDREQTHQSLKKSVIEEAAEVVCAVNVLEKTGNADNLREELGDLLLQIIMQAQIASEEGLFNMEDVCRDISDKMVRRHPHVFGETTVNDSGEVLKNWEEIKKTEKKTDVSDYIFDAFDESKALIDKAIERKKEKK